jgi:hypothetical protein
MMYKIKGVSVASGRNTVIRVLTPWRSIVFT